MNRPYSVAREPYLIPAKVPAFLLGVLPLRISDVIGVAIIAVTLFAGGYYTVHASATLSVNAGEFFQGLAIAFFGCGQGLAIIKLGRSSRP